MSREIFQILEEMNLRQIGTQLALQCAPFLTGVKLSNLLILDNGLREELEDLLAETDVSLYKLLEADGRTYYFLYDEEKLRAHLYLPENVGILRRAGYSDFRLHKLLAGFGVRYRAYAAGDSAFPHEMGVFLGYPAEDVEGFIRNNGKNFLYAGYWKVYDRLPEKKRLFREFDRARDQLIWLLGSGWKIRDIVLGKNHFEPRVAAIQEV